MMTEEEAKARWCPFRAQTSALEAVGKSPALAEGHLSPNCIASQCMAWRWKWNTPPAAEQHRQGYCGMAGRPE